MLRLTDLREILHYVPRFRDRVFVISIDGAVVADENFQNILLDIHLLRSLRIGVALVHGAGLQIRHLAESSKLSLTNSDGIGITDRTTLEVSMTAANRVSHEILEGLSAHDLRGATGNAIVAHPAGILGGIDQQFTGRVERVDTQMIRALLEHDIIPVIPPLGCDGDRRTYRLNSDVVAVEVARALQAVKLIYLAAHEPLRRNSRVLRSLSIDDATTTLQQGRDQISPAEAVSKLENAMRAVRGGVPRVHIIDGRVEMGLLSEVFSNEGIGTLIHANEYESIRMAQHKDVKAVFDLVSRGMQAEELLKRPKADIERTIKSFFVYEVDRTIVSCGAIHLYPEDNMAELATVYVSERYENQGIGGKMIRFAEDVARQMGYEQVFCLSTQAINYFVQKGGFSLGSPENLPKSRRETYDRSGRKSQVLIKKLQAVAGE